MKFSSTLLAFALISTACGTNNRGHDKASDAPDSVGDTGQSNDGPPNIMQSPEESVKVFVTTPKAVINGKTIASCRTPRGPFMVCESDKPEFLQTVSIEQNYADLVGLQVEVQVSFQGTNKTGEIFSIEAGTLAKAEIPEGTNPVLKLTFDAPAQFDLVVSSLLEKNPQPMDTDFSADLKDMKVVVIPGPLTQADWVQQCNQQLFRLNSPGAFNQVEAVEKSKVLLEKIERYSVQDTDIVKETYQKLKAAIAPPK